MNKKFKPTCYRCHGEDLTLTHKNKNTEIYYCKGECSQYSIDNGRRVVKTLYTWGYNGEYPKASIYSDSWANTNWVRRYDLRWPYE